MGGRWVGVSLVRKTTSHNDCYVNRHMRSVRPPSGFLPSLGTALPFALCKIPGGMPCSRDP